LGFSCSYSVIQKPELQSILSCAELVCCILGPRCDGEVTKRKAWQSLIFLLCRMDPSAMKYVPEWLVHPAQLTFMQLPKEKMFDESGQY